MTFEQKFDENSGLLWTEFRHYLTKERMWSFRSVKPFEVDGIWYDSPHNYSVNDSTGVMYPQPMVALKED